mmetsp:Transcript_7172/g.14891  ORF Transcript_7172/g.14891 Transcript_7172/m.14891 type:complete len:133 (-) Transcript_7172:2475-2873(-)
MTIDTPVELVLLFLVISRLKLEETNLVSSNSLSSLSTSRFAALSYSSATSVLCSCLPNIKRHEGRTYADTNPLWNADSNLCRTSTCHCNPAKSAQCYVCSSLLPPISLNVNFMIFEFSNLFHTLYTMFKWRF